MALTKLTVSVDNVQALTDRPNSNEGLTADQLKAAFDQAGEDIKDYLNSTLTPELDTTIANIVAGTGLTNGSVTDDKVAPGINATKMGNGDVTNEELSFINSVTSNVQTQIDAKVPISTKGQANGVVPLNSSAKIDTTYIPDSVLGQLEYQGTYNATTNTPTLPVASSSKGFYYVISTGGTVSGTVYAVGDWIVSNGTAWEKIDNTDAVTTVFGRLGGVVAAQDDYTFAQINKTTSSLADLTTRSASDLNSGTLPVARIPTAIPATSIGAGLVNDTEYGYLDGVTSGIQAQMDAKTPLSHVGAGGSSQHPDATTSQSGFISASDLIYLRSLVPTGLASYAVPVGQIFSLFLRYSQEQDPVTGELVFYEI